MGSHLRRRAAPAREAMARRKIFIKDETPVHFLKPSICPAVGVTFAPVQMLFWECRRCYGFAILLRRLPWRPCRAEQTPVQHAVSRVDPLQTAEPFGIWTLLTSPTLKRWRYALALPSAKCLRSHLRSLTRASTDSTSLDKLQYCSAVSRGDLVGRSKLPYNKQGDSIA